MRGYVGGGEAPNGTESLLLGSSRLLCQDFAQLPGVRVRYHLSRIRTILQLDAGLIAQLQ